MEKWRNHKISRFSLHGLHGFYFGDLIWSRMPFALCFKSDGCTDITRGGRDPTQVLRRPIIKLLCDA